MEGFFAGGFTLHNWLAKLRAGPDRALATRYVVNPFSELVVVERISSKGSQAVPGSKKIFFFCGLDSYGAFILGYKYLYFLM